MLIFDSCERLRITNVTSRLLDALIRLSELSKLNISVIFISPLPWDRMMPNIDYLRYPRLHFVIRNHPANVVYGVDTFRNILHLGIGYKIGFWPSALRDISLRRVHPLLF